MIHRNGESRGASERVDRPRPYSRPLGHDRPVSTNGSGSGAPIQRKQTPPGVVRLIFLCAAITILLGVFVLTTNTDLLPKVLGAIALTAGCVALVIALLVRAKNRSTD